MPRLGRGPWVMAASAILGGCALVFGFGDPVEDEAGRGGTDGASDSASDALAPGDGAVPKGFNVTSTRGWIDKNGNRTLEPLPITSAVEVRVANDGGFAGPFDASSSAVGQLSYGVLPPGERVVTVRYEGSNITYTHVVGGDRLDLGGDVPGRPGTALAAPGSSIKIIATGDSDAGGPGASSDHVGGTFWNVNLPDPTTAIPLTWDVPWRAELYDGTKGDLAWVLRAHPSAGNAIWEVCPFPADYRMNDAGPSTVNVACTTSTRQTVTVYVYKPVAPPGSTPPASTILHLRIAPGGGAFGEIGDTLAYISVPYNTQDHRIEVANPALAVNQTNWTITAGGAQFYGVSRVAPDGGPFTTTDAWQACKPVASSSASLITSLSFIERVTIGGRDALGPTPLTGVGRTPTIAWSRPNTGIVNMYTVDVRSAARNTLAVITTGRTEVTLPPGLLEDGDYQVTVRAEEAAKGAAEEPNHRACAGSTTVATNAFRP